MHTEKFVEWVEPFDPECKYTLICRMTVKDVIDYQKTRKDLLEKGFKYPSDEVALDHFLVVHWARYVD